MNSNTFFLIFFVTVLIVRLYLFVIPIPSRTFRGMKIHHYAYGLVGICVGIFLHSFIVYAISLGFFVDELTYLFIRGNDHDDYFQKVSVLGTLVFVIIVFFLKDYLITFIR